MAWIESHQALSRHKKTLALAALLKTDRHKILGHLHELWWWGIDNADTDGQLGIVPPMVIAEAAGWPISKADVFVDGLIASGFVDRTDSGLVLHDWYDYAGKLNVRRDENRERMRRKRDQPQPPHVPPTSDASAEHVQRTNGARAPATVPNPTVPNRTEQNLTGDDPLGGPPTKNGRVQQIADHRPSKSAAVIDAFRAKHMEVVFSSRDHSAIKHSNAEPCMIAEVYDAVARGEYGDDFMRRRLSVHEAIEWINGYSEWKLDQAWRATGGA
jgi:hypothetical protein